MTRALWTLLALVAAALPVGPALAATPEAVRECVERNLPRYSTPDRAAVAQYVDLEAACRAAIDREEGADVQITPAEEGGAGAAGGSGAGPPAAGDGGGGGAGEPGAAGERAPAAGEAGRGPAGPAEAAGAASPADAVRQAVRRSEAGSPLPEAGGLPAWLIGLLGAVGALVVGAAALEVRRRVG